ncbi:hypothetical protein PN498_23845 [Oscillatoria sp. CS-180]|uniref:ATPase, T2SS/T4P/T4SS family n=1 Tax=Oscillatoria sp. CS-180 TaxID=3021720 RepID=UPI00232FF287|nr:hypothetical protein [Oscillatoria sp. CS-180]MDB9529047.1 hypothetical protein [Oscillatoria sp. CS-180]
MPSPFEDQQSASEYDGIDALEDASLISDTDLLDLNQVYVLIDSILPFEACLYYQVLPLFIEGSRLIVGTVNPDDPAASEYVKKQLSYINYSIGFREIPSDWHRDLLSRYLNHNAKHRQKNHPETLRLNEPSKESVPDPETPLPNQYNTQQTFIVDQPEELSDHEPSFPNVPLKIDHTLEIETLTSEIETLASVEEDTDVNAAEAELLASSDVPLSTPPQSASPQSASPQSALPQDVHAEAPSQVHVENVQSLEQDEVPLHLEINTQYRYVSSTRLSTLPPKELTQALLSKVLDEGIGRLYFERQNRTGRVLWSRDGILQAVVESVGDRVFQGVINEFKLLTHLSLISVKKPKQVEIERSYEGQRILLRLKVMPGAYGEEATLQVLRGTALRFYQQQQIDRLGRDALNAAQTLQNRLNEIRDRARVSISFTTTKSETLPAIIQLLRQMESQIKEILAAYEKDEIPSDVKTNYALQENPPSLSQLRNSDKG